MWGQGQKKKEISLTEGSIGKGLFLFILPLFLGQLLQQLYSMADAWVVGNFADNEAFAAVTLSTHMSFLIVGFFNGISIGGGVVISRYFGAGDKVRTEQAIHNNFLFGIIASVFATAAGLLLTPWILQWMQTPESVLPDAMMYFRIYFGGVSTIVMYNICMAIMRAVGDSLHPLYYLIVSSLTNVVLDLLFVAVFGWGVMGAGIATIFSQGLSAVLCMIQMSRAKDETRLVFGKLKLQVSMLRQILKQGIPSGIQNSVISVGNLVVQSTINTFGAYAISGQGAYAKIEGMVFLPIMSISLALPTFVSQNIGAKQYERAKKGAYFGILTGVIMAELTGLVLYLNIESALKLFLDSPEAVEYGVKHAQIMSFFFFLLAFSHCAAGVLRGCGMAFVPMATMLIAWCGGRILYVTQMIKIFPVFQTISSVYPVTWSISTVVFLYFLFKTDWTKGFDSQRR